MSTEDIDRKIGEVVRIIAFAICLTTLASSAMIMFVYPVISYLALEFAIMGGIIASPRDFRICMGIINCH